MKKNSSRSSFKNPNLLNYPEKQKTPNFRITFSNLQQPQKQPKFSSKEISLIKPSSNRSSASASVRTSTPNYVLPKKTQIFESVSEVENFFDIQKISPIESLSTKKDQEIFFTDVFSDSLLSSILVVFISSYFDFLSEFIDISNKSEISLSKVYKELQNFTIDQLTNQIVDFISLFQSMSISITGPMHSDSISDLEVIFQAEFEKNQTEDIIISSNIEDIPPNNVKVKSLTVNRITGEELLFEYNLRWAVAIKSDKYFPVIFRDGFVADVLYQCTLSHLFGSISALNYSGAKNYLLCYSLRPNDCPLIKTHAD